MRQPVIEMEFNFISHRNKKVFFPVHWWSLARKLNPSFFKRGRKCVNDTSRNWETSPQEIAPIDKFKMRFSNNLFSVDEKIRFVEKQRKKC